MLNEFQVMMNRFFFSVKVEKSVNPYIRINRMKSKHQF